MNRARTYRRLYAFDPADPDLTASTQKNGSIGFGTPPSWTGVPPAGPPDRMTSATGWRPLIASLAYYTLGASTPHRVRISFVENIIREDEYGGGTVLTNERWRQVLFDDVASFVYLPGLAVPVSEENGNPWGLQIETGTAIAGDSPPRAQPSVATVDWEWARAFLDLDHRFFQDWFRFHAEQAAAIAAREAG